VIGRSIGNYKIVRVLGEGGMGTVYLAEHPMIGKRVAVKMLRPDLGTDPGLVSRFFQEAKAVNEIRHPNIVDISDFGHTDDGIVYFVMELMEGQSLRDRLAATGPLPIDEAVACSRQVIDALAAAHRVGIIHRDLKPDNIFMVPDAQLPCGFHAKLFDFGVAKLLGDRQQQVGHKTIDGAVVGTPFYMSPEQALCHDVTAAADIYAMGVVMYEMVTGSVPFRAEQLVLLLNAILKQPAPPPSRARPDTPPWLDRLILRCLEKDPEARPLSMEEVGAVLTAGAAELSGTDPALGATMMAPVGQAAVGTAHPTSPRTAIPRQTTAPRQTAIPQQIAPGQEDAAAAPVPAHTPTVLPRQTAIRVGGLAKPAQAPGLVQRVRAYLETRRVQRFAVPALIFTAGIVVASVFFSHKAERPVTEIVPEVAAEPPAAPVHATVQLNSEPSGAEVTRLGDNRQLGTTPLVDIRPADGRQVNYRFHLAGHTDVQMPIQLTTPGRYEITATLLPVERRGESGARAGSGRRASREHDKRVASQPPAAAPVVAPHAVPVAQPRESLPPPSLPPLGERNPVRRLGR
jgi:serine/threonine-protein kinase